MNDAYRRFERAIVRGVADSFDRAIRPPGDSSVIDVELARRQHEAYCRALEGFGIELVRLSADDRFPDCCFVEDTAIVVGDVVVFCPMGASSRRGEQTAVESALAGYRYIEFEAPATMDGGDVMHIDGELFIGITERTNERAAKCLSDALSPDGVRVIPVPVADFLHLKSACTPLGPGTILIDERFSSNAAFSHLRRLEVPAEEGYAANCLSVNGAAIVSAGFPRTKALVESTGLDVTELDMSEFRRAAGSLTCLSILL
jgi:dimethylargininase